MIELRVLGSLELVASEGRSLDTLRRRPKRAALLAYLGSAVPYGFHSRDRLLALFWPELDNVHARAALSQSLHLLRSALGDTVFVSRGADEIGLNDAAIWCDVRRFETALAQRRAEDALALYRGDFLDGFFLADAPEFERWVERERRRLRHLAADAAWTAAAAKAERGDAIEAARLARWAAGQLPADESVVRRLMGFLQQLGDRAAALREYETFGRELAKEYGLEPSPETQALAAAIRESGTHSVVRRSTAAESADVDRSARARAGSPDRLRTVRRAIPWVLTVTAVFGGAALLRRARSTSPRPLVRFALTFDGLPPHASGIPGSTIALSPDGTRLVYVGAGARGTALFMRDLDRFQAIPIAYSEGAHLPFFSPSGDWLGFVKDNAIVKAKLMGASPVTICPISSNVAGASWGTNDIVVFATPAGLWRVSARGGTPRLVVLNDTSHQVIYRWPEMLPDGRSAIVTRSDSAGSRLVAVRLDSGDIVDLAMEGTNAHFVEGGVIVFARTDGRVLAAPFDHHSLRFVGPTRVIAEAAVTGFGGAAKLGVSFAGALAYVPETAKRTLVIVDRNGHETPLALPQLGFTNARFSPDGRRIALSMELVGGQQDVWIYDQLTKGRHPVTVDSGSVTPIWSPDGQHIVVGSKPAGRSIGFAIRSASVFTPTSSELLLSNGPGQLPYAFTPDGKKLLFRRVSTGRRNEIWVLPLGDSAKPYPYLRGGFNVRAAAISPDGHWVAYVSDESGRDEVSVRAFPRHGQGIVLSIGGGREPRWSASGREIFYRGDHGVVAARIRIASKIEVQSRRVLFDDRAYESWIDGAAYDVHPDGAHFVMIRREPERRDLIVLLNALDQESR